MPVSILMPALSPTMTEGNIAKWLKTVGDEILSGDIIAEVETDKATMEVEAVDEGKLASIIFADGSENVAVNKLIGVIALEGETDQDIKEFIDANSDKKTSKIINRDEGKSELLNHDKIKKEQINEKIVIDEEKTVNKIQPNKNQRILISPLAKRLAELKDIDLSKVTGTGPKGRIIKKDLDSFYSKNHEENLDFSDEFNEKNVINLSKIRKTIARRLQEAKSTIPHFYLKGKVQVDSLVEERKKIKNFFLDNNKNIKISFNDYFIKALALSLKQVPSMNAIWSGNDTITLFKDVDISVAVATDEGLFTPIIKKACSKKIEIISSQIKDFVIKAKNNKLLPEDYTGGCFSISNLGMYGIEEFSAIINPPQSGIIAIGDIKDDVIVIDGEIRVCKTISYTVSVDHRIVDGASASKLLKYFNFYVSNPSAMLI